MRTWFSNVRVAISTIAAGMYVTLLTLVQTYRRKTFTQHFEYPERPVPIRPRYRGFHRYDLTTCIACDQCAKAFDFAVPIRVVGIGGLVAQPHRQHGDKRGQNVAGIVNGLGGNAN